MNDKTEFENKIIEEIKNLIIYDDSLTYGERNSFDRFIVKINQGEAFEIVVGRLLKNLKRLENKEIQPLGLSDGAKKIFIDLNGKYEIPVKDTDYSVFTGTGAGRKLTKKELIEVTIFLIIVIVAYILYQKY
ncbi:hypothetical protein [Lactococcus petauri]|uniref:hypothetical protein n=1 Tax=Lactococcus petauri TaxID=1940789 RepID=UPI001F57BE25|nr:hypothetical protein [Lactococcus petauri]